MATLARQPFAPLDGARLQTLTSLKNRQNGMSMPHYPLTTASPEQATRYPNPVAPSATPPSAMPDR